MNIEIKYKPEIIREEYQQYFIFQRNKVIGRLWFLLAVLFSLSLFIYGFISETKTVLFFGIGFLFILLYIFTRVFVGAKFMLKKFLQNIQKSPLITEGKYIVILNEKGITYQSQKIKNEIPWNKITSAEKNGDSIYLHIEKNRLLDIFSEKLLGKDDYEKVLEIIKSKI